MPLNKIDVLGNIKFANTTLQEASAIDLKRKYVLAASTREEEESLIVSAWLKSTYNDRLLVIVPRHPERLTEILSQLKTFNLEIAVRSKNELPSSTTDIYIADTFGELKQFIAGAEFVLMGGSFVPKGGHNILEVAQLGKAVIFGPDMSNFEFEAALFLQRTAGVQCNLDELPAIFNQLIKDSSEFEKNSINLIKENQDIVNKYYHNIEKHIKA